LILKANSGENFKSGEAENTIIEKRRITMAGNGTKEKGLTVWQPFGELEEIGRNFENIFGRSFLPKNWMRSPEGMDWSPSIDIEEKEDKFAMKVELPGVKEEDISISIAGDTITIEGEKHSESETKKKGYYYSEASYGSFSRSITMPSSANTEKIEASYDKGVLEVNIPKYAEIKTKKVAISAKKKEDTAKKKPVTGTAVK
jgi:HSP20 family protein